MKKTLLLILLLFVLSTGCQKVLYETEYKGYVIVCMKNVIPNNGYYSFKVYFKENCVFTGCYHNILHQEYYDNDCLKVIDNLEKIKAFTQGKESPTKIRIRK